MNTKKTSGIKRTSSFLFILRLIRMSFSMITIILSAKYFGVSMQKDVWILVTTLITTVCGALFGPINETFRAKFIFIKEEFGEKNALSMTLSLIFWMLIILVIITLLLGLFKHLLVDVLYSDELSPLSIHVFEKILIIMLPTLFINQLTNIGISMLNAYEIYYLPETVGVFTGILNLGIIIWLAPIIGIYSLCISNYIAILLLFAIILRRLLKIRFERDAKIPIWSTKGFINYFIFALPFYFPYFVGQANALAEKWLGGLLGSGMISSIDYARQFTIVLNSTLSSILATMMLPLLSKAYSRKNIDDFRSILNENISIVFLIVCVTATVLFGSATPLCQFFFNRGSIDAEMMSIITKLTRAFAVSFIGLVMYVIMGNAMLAANLGKKYAIIGVGVQISVLVSNISLLKIVGWYIFPISLFVSHFLGSIIMSIQINYIDRYQLYKTLIKNISVVCTISCALYIFNLHYIASNNFLQLLLNVPILLVLTVILSKFLGIDLVSILQRKAYRK